MLSYQRRAEAAQLRRVALAGEHRHLAPAVGPTPAVMSA